MAEAAEGSRLKWAAGLALLAAVMALVVALWFAFSIEGQRLAEPNEPVPIVRAPDGPDRTRPDDPGGADVPDQDKQVYETFRAPDAREAGEVERLLPAEEAPLPDPPVAAREPEPEPEPDPQPEPEPAPQPEPEPEPEPTPEPTPAPPPRPAAAPSGVWQVQLAALRDEAAAMQTWTRIAGKQAGLLKGLTPTVNRVETEQRGVFYRLRTGTFGSRAEANALCEKLKQAGQDCLVAKAP